MDAIVLAGGVPKPGEPLYEVTQGKPKALLDVAGQPMLQWVLNALDGAASVDRIIIVGLPEDVPIHSAKPLHFLPSQGHMVNNILAGADVIMHNNPQAELAFVVSADIPAITAPMVDWLAAQVTPGTVDACYTIVQRHVMEKRYPESRRSYTRLKDMTVCGGDINLFRPALAHSNTEFWDRVIEARKNVFKQAALVGYDTLVLLLMRQLSLDAALQRICRRLKIRGRAIISPYAEMGMDVDKPFQLDIIRADLAARQA
ncbi:MAG: hypothetical protein Fur0018_09640 [Anaerolineales bacterium]